MAGEINRDYTDGKMTSTSIWPTVWSAYPGEAFAGGPILANTPWSGHYTVGTSLWAVAQTTQFAKPGWRYLDSGSS